MLGLYFGIGNLLLFSFGVFVRPIVDVTGWDRTMITTTISPASIGIGLMSLATGWLVDRFGPRAILIVSSITQGLGLVLIGLYATSLPAFGLLVVLASLLGGAQTPVPYAYLIVGWFRRQRGLAMGLALAGGGLGIATMPFLVAMTIAATNWHTAYLLMGIVSTAVTLPVAILLVRNPPVVDKEQARGTTGFSLRQAAGTPAFWTFLLAFFLNAVTAAGGSISLPSIIADRGVTPTQASLAMVFVGGAVIGARIGFGALLDRFRPVAITAFVLSAPVVGHLLLLTRSGLSAIIAAALCFGISTGAEGDALSFLLSRRFGMRSFGRIFGLNFLAFAFGTGLGPALFNLIRARDGYTAAYVALAGLGLFGSVLLASQARRPLPFS